MDSCFAGRVYRFGEDIGIGKDAVRKPVAETCAATVRD